MKARRGADPLGGQIQDPHFVRRPCHFRRRPDTVYRMADVVGRADGSREECQRRRLARRGLVFPLARPTVKKVF